MIRGGIAGNVHGTRDCVNLQIPGGAGDIDCTASRGGFNAIICVGNVDGAGGCVGVQVAFNTNDGHISGSAVDVQHSANRRNIDGAAGSADAGVPFHAIDVYVAGSGAGFHWSTDVFDREAAGGNAGVHFRVLGDLDVIFDGDVSVARRVFPDADSVVVLFDGRIGRDFVDALLRTTEKRPAAPGHGSMDVNFAVGTAADIDIPGAVAEF